ncbi:helix-turn-helix domain-containing protein [Nocardia sp. ET3-3]|uniref:Helix-turn-helix domain-containing protein n=1 Tax=Nocardia terrae TaxID=2675851 RepID=A0A7K1USI1_9NOCA|nr:helix-turn-helix domain-containing protein [Nocardia terrae]MVU77241.1 helix-turn-helix domain-containing protein [Nocardia terrae]
MTESKSAESAGPSGSPPTERVVAVVELLAGRGEPMSVSEIAGGLDLNRSTVGLILGALEGAGWVARRQDRRYELGVGLVGVAEAVRETVPLLHGHDHALRALADRTGCGVALAHIGTREATIVGIARGNAGIPTEVGIGTRLPLAAPLGATVVAHRPPNLRRAWLDTAAPELRQALSSALEIIADTGLAVFALGRTDPRLFAMLAEMSEVLSAHPGRVALRRRVFDMMTELAAAPYDPDRIAAEGPLSISFLAAPIAVGSGRPAYELQLGPMRTGVEQAERELMIRELLGTARELVSI